MDLGANSGRRRDRVALPDEAGELLDALRPLDRVPYALAFYGGPRHQDIRRVEWSDLERVESKGGGSVLGFSLFIRPLDNRRRRRRLPARRSRRARIVRALTAAASAH